MAVDYDLVILGGTPEGYEAATQAMRYGARVALILQDLEGARSPLYERGLLQLTPDHPLAKPSSSSTVTAWQWAKQQAALIADTLTGNALQELMVQGVDVIAERGKIIRDRPVTVTTVTRKLTTRTVLIATGNQCRAPSLTGLDDIAYDTPTTFWRREHLPTSTVILGGQPEGLALAQWLASWQVTVTVVTAQTELLHQEDPEISDWLAAQLRAAGIDLRLGAQVVEVGQPTTDMAESAIALKLTDDIITASTLVVAARPLPNTDGLGLEHCLARPSKLTVNPFLQTAHSRIYACGAAIGGYELPAIARQEAQLAVHNALFWQRRRVDYSTLPYDLPTQPPMARVGLTEPQAIKRFGADQVLVAKQSLYDNPAAQWRDSTVGFCQLIAHRDGRLLGGHGVGPEAQEWVQTVALLITNKVPWWRMANFPALPYSLTELLRQTAQQWEGDRWQPGQWRRDWAENWCNWRRSR